VPVLPAWAVRSCVVTLHHTVATVATVAYWLRTADSSSDRVMNMMAHGQEI
jgi:hypothetical protein